jgi:hypothetical protein
MGIVRPAELTPLTVDLEPGEYLIEAALPNLVGNDNFAEVYWTLRPSEQQDSSHVRGLAVNLSDIQIKQSAAVISDMVRVPIRAERRQKNSQLPEVIYVDTQETTSIDGQQANDPTKESGDRSFGVAYDSAHLATKKRGKRLASADEYDAIVESVTDGTATFVTSGEPATMDDLFGGLPEWTTTKYAQGNDNRIRGPSKELFLERQILKGYGETYKAPAIVQTVDGQLLGSRHDLAPQIGVRGVRSGAPRFLKQ